MSIDVAVFAFVVAAGRQVTSTSHGSSVAPPGSFGDGSSTAAAHLSYDFETLDIRFSAILEIPSSHALHFDVGPHCTFVPRRLESLHADALARLLSR